MALIKKHNELLLNLFELYYLYKKYKKAQKTRIWTKVIYTKDERESHGFFHQAYQLIKAKDDAELRKVMRMSVSSFQLLLNLLEGRLTKTSRREPIQPECRLVLTLVYLGQGAKFQTLAWSFRLGVSTVRKIVLETCEAIWDELHNIYLAPPVESEWKEIATAFNKKTGLPHCVGCIDGKHIKIKCPPRSGSLYYNYKHFYSIVLLAACDHNYTFTAVDIGAYGSQSDGGILRASSFGSRILNNKINLPKSTELVGTNNTLPFFFAGDAAFPLRTNIMRPYPGRYLSEDKAKFNEVLSKARCRIENTFGIMTMRWRVLADGMLYFPENAEKVVKAVAVLHNFVKLNDAEYCTELLVDHYDGETVVPGEWRQHVASLPQTKLFSRFNAPKEAFKMRDLLKDYINKN